MKILYVSSEVAPFSKTGGLGDVAGTLPGVLKGLGHEVVVFTPFYRQTRKIIEKPEMIDAKIDVTLDDKTSTARFALAKHGDVNVYFLINPEYYEREGIYSAPQGDYMDNAERYIFFARACMEMIKSFQLDVDVIHCNDWQAALIPVYMKTLYADDEAFEKTATVLTIHNLAYQGLFWHWDMPLTGLGWKHFNWKELEFYGKMNLLKGGIVYADKITTVSKKYSKEFQTKEFGVGLHDVLASRKDDITGIMNGIDYVEWNPATDKLISKNYSAKNLSGKAACKKQLQKSLGLPVKDDVPLIGMVSRLTGQKGIDIFAEAAPEILGLGCQIAVLGAGEKEYQRMLKKVARRHQKNFSLNIKFSNRLAHRIEAGSDIYLMPSLFEPCGMNQLFSIRYGTIPVVRRTGGLADTITNYTAASLKSGKANGFAFKDYSAGALLAAVKKAVKLFGDKKKWKQLMLNGMKQEWTWERSAKNYEKVFNKAVKSRTE